MARIKQPDLSSIGYEKAEKAGFPVAQCTWYAWGRAYEKMGVSLNVHGWAGQWYKNVVEEGYVEKFDDGFYENSIGVFKNHVIFIEDIEYDDDIPTIVYSEANVPQNNVLDKTDGHIVSKPSNELKDSFGGFIGCICLSKQNPNTGA